MYKKLVSALYIFNIVSQAVITLIIPLALGFGVSWLLVTYLSCPRWIYAVLITLGALSGFYSMAALDRLEKERNASKNSNKTGNNNE